MKWKNVSDSRVTQIYQVVGEYNVLAHVFLPLTRFRKRSV